MGKTSLILGAISLAALSLLLAQEILFWNFTIDDAYIGYRYARHLANGYGISWNVGGDPVEGYSNFLWVLLLSLYFKAGSHALAWAKLTGAFLGYSNLGLAFLNARLLCRSRQAALLPPLLLAITPAYAVWAVSGMETQLFLLFFLLSLYLFAREARGENHLPLSALTLLCLALTRVEGAAVFLFLAILRLGQVTRRESRGRSTLAWLLLFILPYLAYTTWRVSYFGYLLPNATYDKLGLLAGRAAVLGFIRFCLPYLLLSVYPIVAKPGRAWSVPACAAGLALIAAAINTDPVMGFYYRYLLPVLAVVFILSAATVEMIFARLREKRPRGRYALSALLIFLLAYPPLSMNLPRMLSTTARMNTEFERSAGLATWLRERLPPGSSIAIENCGIIPHVSDYETIDLWGLNDERIARKGFDVSYVLGRRPTAIILTGDASEPFRPKGRKDAMIYENDKFQGEYELVKTVRLNAYAAYWVFALTDISSR